MTEQVDVLLTGGIVVTMDESFTVWPDGAVAIRGDSIVAVGAAATLANQFTATDTIDCQGQAIIPGLVNSHTHVPMTLLRGLNDDLRLDVWLGYLMPLEREFVNPEFVKLGTQIACAEMIRSGITTFADMYYFESDIAEATAEAGLRALLGQTILMFPAPDADTYEDALVLCRRFIEKWNGHPLVQPAVAHHAWYTATPDLMRACADLARGYNVPLHTHVSETALEVENCRAQNTSPVVPWIQKHGLLDTKLLAAHCVHLDKGEMNALKKAGAGVAHCPTSNLKLASGIAQVGEMVKMGLNVGVGTDGPASNNDLDMFEEMRLAALLAKTKTGDPTTLPAREAMELATIGGARAVHMAHLTGSLEAGKRADIAIVDMTGTHNWPQFNNNPDAVYSRLIYAAKSTDVAHVICNGQWLMRGRELLTIDEVTAKTQAAAIAARIDTFVLERESSPYNKLLALAKIERQESFEVQVKVPLADDKQVLTVLESEAFEVTRYAHFKQYDSYFIFNQDDPYAARLRYREDDFINEKGDVTGSRQRLTLLGESTPQRFPNAVMLSRTRYMTEATQTLRFYREYFAPPKEVEVTKERRRWHVIYKNTDFALNLDRVLKPDLGYFLEIKARTWSRADAERKADLISELLQNFGADLAAAARQEYVELAQSTSA